MCPHAGIVPYTVSRPQNVVILVNQNELRGLFMHRMVLFSEELGFLTLALLSVG